MPKKTPYRKMKKTACLLTSSFPVLESILLFTQVRSIGNKVDYSTRYTQRLQCRAQSTPFAKSPTAQIGQTDLDEEFSSTPLGWCADSMTPWRRVYEAGSLEKLPASGWKIHISTIFDEAEQSLSLCSEVCQSFRIPFKHLQSARELDISLGKYADRKSGGKFITVYPYTEDQFIRLLDELGTALNGMHGPYILTDIQFKKTAPVFFRYGAFHGTFLTDGRIGIPDPTGEIVPDARDFLVTRPKFVTIPDKISTLVAKRDSAYKEKGNPLDPYEVISALHFSFGGGVYRAVGTRDQKDVVIKEARAWAGYSSRTVSATDRLKGERTYLQRLSSSRYFPKYVDWLTRYGNSYLVEEFIEGRTLQSWIASKYPLLRLKDSDNSALKKYEKPAMEIAKKIVLAIKEAHAKKIALMDIQPKNVLVLDNNDIKIIDLESARDLEASSKGAVGTPGFVPFTEAVKNLDRDRYALAQLLMYIFAPSLEPTFSAGLDDRRMEFIKKTYSEGVFDFIEEVRDAVGERLLQPRFGVRHVEIGPQKDSANETIFSISWDVWRDGLIEGIKFVGLNRLDVIPQFPGDYRQFDETDLGASADVESGAAGVMMSLIRLKAWDTMPDKIKNRIVDTLLSSRRILPMDGLLRGQPGIALTLLEAGYREQALQMLNNSWSDAISGRNISVRTGLAGTVLAYASALAIDSTAELPIQEAADQLRSILVDGCDALPSRYSETGNPVGVFDGWSGVALACQALFQLTGDSYWERMSSVLLERDIAHLKKTSSGCYYVNYGGVNYCYLSEGSAGIGYVAHIIDPERYSEVLTGVQSGLTNFMSLNTGLFQGICGCAATLLEISSYNSGFPAQQISDAVKNHGLEFADMDGAYMLGNDSLYISLDYATGTAGFLLVGQSIAESKCLWTPWSPILFSGHVKQ